MPTRKEKMGSISAQKPMRIREKLTECARKLKKIFKFLNRGPGSNYHVVNYSVPSPHIGVTCEELFLTSGGAQKGHRRNDHSYDHDPFMAAHIAAQNHFTLRPNIYI
ncbi:unnamed protein product [Dovyalis caffra]|uniref:Uncharacterized protein n=1 Tax=Dovyalis caffra TaxID=77055 RepID=A0AAV1SFB8_9ROSI|nr:unnamed protein product [Dovyalis caffra]